MKKISLYVCTFLSSDRSKFKHYKVRSKLRGVEKSESTGGFSKAVSLIFLTKERLFCEKNDFFKKFDRRFLGLRNPKL